MRSLGELLEKGYVRVVLDANVRDTEPLQRHAPRPHAECPPRVALRVQPRRLEHAGMHHAAAEDLDPSRLLAGRASGPVANSARHVHLRRWLGERKVARAEARLRLAAES